MTNNPLDQATLEAVARVRANLDDWPFCLIPTPITNEPERRIRKSDLRTILDALAPKLPEQPAPESA